MEPLSVSKQRIGFLIAGAILLGFGGGPLRAEVTIGLSEALRTGLNENPGVRAAALNEMAAGHRVASSRSGLFPVVSFSSGYTRYEEPMSVTPIHRVGQFPTLDDEIYETGIGVLLPLFSGRVLSDIDMAKSSASEAAAVNNLTQMEMIKRIAEIFIAGRELADNRRLLDSHIAALRQRREELGSLHSEGRVSLAEISLIDASIGVASADRRGLESRDRELALNLGRLLGWRKAVRPEPVDLNENALVAIEADDAADSSGPLAIQAKARLDGAKYGKNAVARSLWPELTGFAAYSWRSGSDQDYEGEWAMGLNLRIPLFDIARRWSALQAAESGFGAAQNRYLEAQLAEQSLGEVYREKQESLGIQRDHLSGAVASKTISVTAFRDRYSEGRLSLSDLLKQESELLQLRMQERNFAYQRATAFIDYHALKGTLTPVKIASILED